MSHELVFGKRSEKKRAENFTDLFVIFLKICYYAPLSVIASVLVVFFSIRINMYFPEGQGRDVIRGCFFISLPSKLPGGVFDPRLCS